MDGFAQVGAAWAIAPDDYSNGKFDKISPHEISGDPDFGRSVKPESTPAAWLAASTPEAIWIRPHQ